MRGPREGRRPQHVANVSCVSNATGSVHTENRSMSASLREGPSYCVAAKRRSGPCVDGAPVLLAPPWARTSHVVQLRPVEIEAMAPQAKPELDRFNAEMP